MVDLIISEIIPIRIIACVILQMIGSRRITTGEVDFFASVDLSGGVVKIISFQERGSTVLFPLQVTDEGFYGLRIVLVDGRIGNGTDHDDRIGGETDEDHRITDGNDIGNPHLILLRVINGIATAAMNKKIKAMGPMSP